MARTKLGSPTLHLTIGEEDYEQAVRSKSGGCLIADAIKKQYPQFTSVVVDMATIRFSHRGEGRRFTYLTPPKAQHLLLSFDQGWPQATDEITLQGAVKITPITTSTAHQMRTGKKREERKAELEAKVARGEELTVPEKRALTRVSNAKPAPERPLTYGPAEVKGRHHGETVVVGGRPIVQGEPHPNLLRGTDRHYGAKLADPGVVFKEAVEAAVAARLAGEDSSGS